MSFFTLFDLRSFYFTSDQYIENGYSITDLYNNGYTIDDLYECGYTVQQIYDISALQYPNTIGVDYLKSKIDITYGSNGLKQIINTTTYPLGPLFTYYTNTLHNNYYEIQRLFQLYDIIDLYAIGFGISFMKSYDIPIRTLYKLIENNIIQYINLKNGDQKNGFNNIGYTLLDIYSLNNQDTTIINMYESLHYSMYDFKKAGFTSLQMKNAGVEINRYITNYNNNNTIKSTLIEFNPLTLYFYGNYSIIDLYNSGYTASEFYSVGFTIELFIIYGLTISQIKIIFGDISLDDFIVLYNAKLRQLLDANYTISDIFPYRNRYHISEFLNNGFSYYDLYLAGFTFYDFYNGTNNTYLYDGRYAMKNQILRDILKFHYNVSELIPFDISISLYYDTSFSSLDLYNNGFTLYFLKEYYSLVNFKRDLIPVFSLYESGFYTFLNFETSHFLLIDYFNANLPMQFFISHYTVEELISVGYTIDQILNIYYFPVSLFRLLGYPVVLLAKYYDIDKLEQGGYSKRDLNIEGNNISQYCCTKKNVLYSQPSILGSSMNETRSSSKMSYSKNIKSKAGGSYSTSYSSYLSTTNKQDIPALCANSFNSTTASTAKSSRPCASINIYSKTSDKFSYFIRNYITQQVYLYNNGEIGIPPNPKFTNNNLNTLSNTIINNIYLLQKSNPDIPIFTLIQNYFSPPTTIISGPF